jgi:hypothetical protein
MNPIYVPILKAKQGEFDALAHLSQRASERIVPLFDIPPKKEGENTNVFLHKKAEDIAKVWANSFLFDDNKSIFCDVSKWRPDEQTENGEHVVCYLYNQLEYMGVSVNPIIRYDFFDDPVYVNALKNIKLENERHSCIRLDMDVDTVADIMADPDYVSERLSNIIQTLELNPAKTYVLIDFGDVSRQSHFIEEMVDNAKQAISLVQQCGFSQIMLGGASNSHYDCRQKLN